MGPPDHRRLVGASTGHPLEHSTSNEKAVTAVSLKMGALKKKPVGVFAMKVQTSEF